MLTTVYCCVSQLRISDSWSDRLIRASLHGCLDRRRRMAQEMSYKAGLAGWATFAGSRLQVHCWPLGEKAHLGQVRFEEGHWVHINWDSGGGFHTFSPGGNPQALPHTDCSHNTLTCTYISTHTSTHCLPRVLQHVKTFQQVYSAKRKKSKQ